MSTTTTATTNSATTSPVLRVPPAEPEVAAAHFAARLAHYTDASDVHAALESGDPGFTLIDSRGDAAWTQGHVPGAVHLPTARIPAEAAELLEAGMRVVTYCWGPGCDGAARAALALALQGYQVKEMLGGIEYWVREGFTVETSAGRTRRAVDDLTAPAGSVTCDC